MAANQPNWNWEADRDSPDPLIDWQDEAAAIIRDVQNHVKDIKISTKQHSSKTEIFLNITTLEDKAFCIRISCDGFQVVGRAYDSIDWSNKPPQSYDTPYALLNEISAGYVQSFGNNLTNELEKLKENQKD